MDIRGFFGGGKSTKLDLSAPSSGALDLIRKEREPKSPTKKAAPPKKRSEKLRSPDTKSVEAILLESDSDGESPLPSSMRKQVMEQQNRKRHRVAVSSDSDESILPKSAQKPPRSSGKAHPKSKKTKIIESDSDVRSVSPSPVKRRKSPKRKPKKNEKPLIRPDSDSDDVEMISGTDSENEFVEKKKPRKKGDLLPGQKKLSFTQSTAKPAEDKSKSSRKVPQHVAASDFFGSSSGGVPKKSSPKKSSPPKKRRSSSPMKSNKKNTEEGETAPSTSVTTEKKKTSPSQKENVHKEKAVSKPAKEPEHTKRTSPRKEKSARKSASPPRTTGEKTAKSSQPRSVAASSEVTKPTSKKPVSSTSIVSSQPKRAEPPRKVQEKPTSSAVSTPRPRPAENQPEPEVPWVDKYKPKSFGQLVGQHGEKSPMNKLLGWLRDWAKHNLGEGGKQKKAKPAPWAAGQDGTPFKAALLSGSPGVGKTTCAYLACEMLGFNKVEMNASDVRNKKHLEAQVAQLTGSHQIEEYFGKKSTITGGDEVVHHVLIMDEVDGMSGNEDRNGVSELIQIIKDTKIPIICICNDRGHPKMRSLVNHCFDLRFPKPRVEQIRGRMMTIAMQEKLKISKEELDEIIELSGHDVRQVIYNLQMRGITKGDRDVEQKDFSVNTFDAARRLLDSRTSLKEKQEMFFVDYGIMPLFVQENYPNMKNDKHKPADALAGLRRAADLISLGDHVDRCVRGFGAWKLLNEQSMIGCALPALATGGHLRSMIQFPAWLGKQSTAGKRQRLMRQLASHAHLKLSADTKSLVTDYVPVLRERLTKPLIQEEAAGIPQVVASMVEYDLVKDDADAIAELAVWPGKIDPAAKIQSKVKAGLTRAMNKVNRLLPYAVEAISKGKRRKGEVSVEIDEEGNLCERKEDDDESDGEEEEEKAVAVVRTSAGGTTAGRGGAARGAKRGGRGRGKS